MAYIRSGNGGGGGIVKSQTESTFTISANGTKTITVSDMTELDFLYGTVKWNGTFGYLYSEATGDKSCSAGVWSTSGTTYLHVSVSGNVITIRNGANATATVSGTVILYR